MSERRRLGNIELEGFRAWLYRTWSAAMIGLPVLGAIGYLLPAHKVDGATEWHSNYADGGVFPLVMFGAVFAIAIGLRRARLGAGMATGVLAAGGAIGALLPVVLVHMLSHVEQSTGEGMFLIGVLGLFMGGIAMLVVEPLLYVTQRRSLERRDPPPLPIARLV